MTEYSPLTLKIIENILAVPEGKVSTYGRIALLSGSPKAARQVVRVLSSLTESFSLPWHRIVNSQGVISIKNYDGFVLQKSLLQKEGVIVSEDEKIDLKKYLF
ncbi:MAG: MGMT family protein [Candidatus Delongbacteria bacterium]|nr:MGMT family protein [Candidatus Delongbacteria bacterium]MBN2834422.1 MGMT family protein [Candidatus Delongbacteria bacterium]